MLILAGHALPGHHGITSGPTAAVQRNIEGQCFRGKHWKLPPWIRAHGSCGRSADPDCIKLSDRLLGVKDLTSASMTGGGVDDEMISGDNDSTLRGLVDVLPHQVLIDGWAAGATEAPGKSLYASTRSRTAARKNFRKFPRAGLVVRT